MNEYRISVIVPVFKAEKYIGTCCQSLFEQSLRGVEYIFIDDRTPDNSIEVVREVLEQFPAKKKHVKIISHDRNLGVACARNTGLENATGEYILFVDADDWIEPNAMSIIHDVACKENVDVVGFDWFLEFKTNRRYLKQPVYEDVKECLKAMLSGELRWYLWAFLVRRSLYLEHCFKFLPGLNVGEDMMMLLKLFSVAESYKHIQQPLYHYTQQNKDSITRIDAQKQLMIVKQNAEDVISYLHGKYGDAIKQEIHFLMLNIKFPLLISRNKSNYDLWNESFAEANASVWENKRLSFHSKCLQWMAVKRQYWFLWLYYMVLFKFVYGVLYR